MSEQGSRCLRMSEVIQQTAEGWGGCREDCGFPSEGGVGHRRALSRGTGAVAMG